jgi:tetratricopeptide (TPR) repeat protein
MQLLRLGKFDAARIEAQRTLYLAPLSPRFEQGLGEIYFYAGRYDDAIAQASKALALDSTFVTAHLVQAGTYAQQGRFDQARTALRRCEQLGCPKEARWLVGYIEALERRHTEARRILDELKKEAAGAKGPPDVSGIASVLTALGERAQALDWLERGVGSGSFMAYLAVDPVFRPLRDEPRFRAVLRRVGLPDRVPVTDPR